MSRTDVLRDVRAADRACFDPERLSRRSVAGRRHAGETPARGRRGAQARRAHGRILCAAGGVRAGRV